MSFTLHIAQSAVPVVAAPGQSVLEAALAAGVPYPHGCRSGNCGACKSHLEEGEVERLPCSDYALSQAERAAGMVLACRTVPWSDARLSWLEADEVALHPERRLSCRVVGIGDLTHDIKQVFLTIDSGGPFDFSAGQYAALRFGTLPPRDYSMAHRPDERVLE
ncbi:MAG TPA: 2Fe-2S iron-sulfur cluster-binding protein, partial [Stellaceae bacterium]|nr:2Fe-2S iron-sulfur cluster-binding protein [Stellaceae bacterium]